MPDQSGFEIYGRFYPEPQRFRMGDPVLVNQVTGLSWPDFASGLDEMAKDLALSQEQGRTDFMPDQVLLLGLMAVSFWQGNQQMTRTKVVKAVERIPMEDVKYIVGDEDTEDDADPPAPTAVDGSSSSTTSSESAASPEADLLMEDRQGSTLAETSPNGSGVPGLLSVPPESLPA